MEADALSTPLFVVKAGLYSSALSASGIALHCALGVFERESRRPALMLAAVLGGVALLFCAMRLLLINAQLGADPTAAFNAANFGWTWAVQGAATWTLVAGALILLVALTIRPLSLARALAGLAALAFAASFALTGHTQSLESPSIAPWAVAAHALIAAFWIAAPISLWPYATLANGPLAARMRRFGFYATMAIPILFALGLWLLWRLAGGWDAVFSCAYGQLLLAKLAIASVALGLGAFNKVFVTNAIEASPERGRKWLAGTLSLDALLFAVALGLVSWATTILGPPEA